MVMCKAIVNNGPQSSSFCSAGSSLGLGVATFTTTLWQQLQDNDSEHEHTCACDGMVINPRFVPLEVAASAAVMTAIP
ncbi:GL14037 [Drosophila persimilis]|uniref:GL14037 n=1 Tax=Drosophila persimilis TaxID=7234 RepID=B4GNK0_DROPE|nr:GL14037 [Drosophila persimilis]